MGLARTPQRIAAWRPFSRAAGLRPNSIEARQPSDVLGGAARVSGARARVRASGSGTHGEARRTGVGARGGDREAFAAPRAEAGPLNGARRAPGRCVQALARRSHTQAGGELLLRNSLACPRPARRAMCAGICLRAFASTDIGDGPSLGARGRSCASLDAEAVLADPSERRAPMDCRTRALILCSWRWPMRAERFFAGRPPALVDLIEGVRRDVDGVTYERFDDLGPLLPPGPPGRSGPRMPADLRCTRARGRCSLPTRRRPGRTISAWRFSSRNILRDLR